MFKKFFSLVICICLTVCLLNIAPSVKAASVVQKEISLFDLSGISSGVINKKGNSSLPPVLNSVGVTSYAPCWGVSHGFNGTQEIVKYGGKQVWRIKFDVPMSSNTWMNDIDNEVSVKFKIPEELIPYVTAIKLEMTAKASDGNLQYRFGVSNESKGIGSLAQSSGLWEGSFSSSTSNVTRTVSHTLTDLYQMDLSGFYCGAAPTLSTKWRNGDATELFLMLTSSGCKGTGGAYILIKDVKITVNIPSDQYSSKFEKEFTYEYLDMVANFQALTNGGKLYNKATDTFEAVNKTGMIITSQAALKKYGFTSKDLTLENIENWKATGHNIADWIFVSDATPSSISDIYKYSVKMTNLGMDLRKENVVFKTYLDYTNQNLGTVYETFEGTLDRVVYGEKYREKFYAKYGANYTATMEAWSSVDYGDKIFDDAVWEDMANKGIDYIRLPIRPSGCTDSNGKITEERFKILDKVLFMALKHGFSVIVDMHGYTNISGDYNGNRAHFEDVWNQIATRYAILPESVAFQIINEPSTQRSYSSENKDPMTNAELMALQERIIRSFRKIPGNENRLAVIGTDTNGYWNYGAFTSSLLSLDNLMIDFHFYEPMTFTHSGAEWCQNADGSLQFPANATDYSSMDPAAAFQKGINLQKQYPNIKYVFMGEWGVYKAEYNAKLNYFDDVTRIAEQYGVPWCLWFGAGNPGAWDENIIARIIRK